MTALLISGYPASGKSTFCQWLAAHHGYTHVETDPPANGIDSHGLRSAWDACGAGETAAAVAPFMEELARRDRPIAFEWGFPPSSLPRVRALKAAGLPCWWFDADEQAAREAFSRRAPHAMAAFEDQVAQLRTHRAEILAALRPNIIETLSAAGRHLAPAAIWRRVAP